MQMYGTRVIKKLTWLQSCKFYSPLYFFTVTCFSDFCNCRDLGLPRMTNVVSTMTLHIATFYWKV